MSLITVTDKEIQTDFQAKPDESINKIELKEHVEKYPDRWNTAFKFLIESDLESMELGRTDLDKNVFVAVSEYDTKNPEDALYESHEKYIDIQYIISGEEWIGLTNNKSTQVITPYNASNDIAFYDFDGGKLLDATPDKYFIFFPNDIHKPCVKKDSSAKVKKVVVKIRYK